NRIAIGDVAKVADPERAHLEPSVSDGKSLDLEPQKIERAFDPMCDYPRQTAILRRLERVRIDSFEAGPRSLGRIARDRAAPEHQRSRVVQTKTMIGVRVSEQNRIELLEADPQGLLAKIGGSIYQDIVASMLDQHRRAQSFVPEILGQTGLAVAADR